VDWKEKDNIMSEQQSFNPREHIIQIKTGQGTQEYLPVQWRLVWFRKEHPRGTIETELIHLDVDKETEAETFVWNPERRRSEKITKQANGLAIFRATVKDGEGGMATATKMETAASFPDYLEKAETGSIGRALAALGYGTQFTADELDESHRIVDSPVDRGGVAFSNSSAVAATRATGTASQKGNANGIDETAEASATEQQIASIRKLCQHLGKAEPENVASISFLAAKRIIQQLTAEYKEAKQNSKAS
jgi:hypothetical protein